jgi:hypothetical protein
MDQRTIAVVIGHVEVQETTTVRQVSLHARPYGPLGAALRVGGIGSIVWAFFFTIRRDYCVSFYAIFFFFFSIWTGFDSSWR